MTLMTRVLVATDLSAPARHAVERAALVAEQAKAQLHIIHAVKLDMLDSLRELLGADLSQTKQAVETDARARLEQLVAEPTVHRGLSPHCRVASGSPIEVIPREAAALDAALLVFGARGESFLHHTIVGSTTAGVMRTSTRWPVLVVKQTPHEPYRQALIAVDFSPASLCAARAARRFAPHAKRVLVHAFELAYTGFLRRAGVEQAQITDFIHAETVKRRIRLHEFASEAGLEQGSYTVDVRHGDIGQQIMAVEQEVGADLIAVGKHGAHFTEELLLGSVTQHVIASTQADVLVASGSALATV